MLNGAEQSSPRVYTLQECSHFSFPPPTGSESKGRLILPKTTSTRFKRLPTSSNDDTWDLQALLLCYLRKDKGVGEYAPEAIREGVALVGVMERRIVNDYLDGREGASTAAAAYIIPEASALRPGTDVSVEATLAETQSGAAAGVGAVAATNLAADGARPAKKARYVVNKEDLEAYKRIVSLYEVRQLSDRTTVLRGNGTKTGNFASVRELVAEGLKQGRDELRSAPTGGSAAAAVQPLAAQQRKRKQITPIIVISPSSSALITMYNVKRFLEDAVFEPSDVARAQAGRIADDALQISHRRQIGALAADAALNAALHGLSGQQNAERAAMGEKLARYWVVDGVDALSRFGDDAWWVDIARDRVYWVDPSFATIQGPCRLCNDDWAGMAIQAI